MDEICNIIMKVLSQSSSIVDHLRSDIKLSDFIKNIFICVLKMNEGLKGFELNEGG